ncbi:M48 family peptidase [Thalassotalea euphylliae]|uniref:M48 family peptidase n=1 Tax=Thalassotalea euphylliae TaxID=1655234 RepID=A0A3E0TQS6_9GAMM|nr:M48 family metallopeptidase [Thalassotalea euphylliae]REL26382.1 M48 family peptidase [Thalassotalea euphylliae]
MKRSLSVIALTLLINACSTSSTGRQQITLFSSGELNKMGAASFEQLKEKEKIYQDSATNRYVRCIANDIIEQLPGNPKPSDWEVVVFDSEQVNAFALPGGKIGVYTGILKVAETPAQLAAIIGHEVAHVIEQHSNERMSSGQLAQIGLQAADAAMASQNVQNRNAWMAGLGLGLQYGVLMPYGRTHESEADIVGQKLMAKAGYDPKAAIQLWRNMAKGSKGAPPEFMSTHPSSDTRIRQLTNNLPNVNGDYQASSKGQCHLG